VSLTLKALSLFTVFSTLCLLLQGCAADSPSTFRPWTLLLLLPALFIGGMAVIATRNYRRYVARRKRERARRRDIKPISRLVYVLYALALLFILLFALLCRGPAKDPAPSSPEDPGTATTTTVPQKPSSDTVPPESGLSPASVSSSDPSLWGISWEVFENGTATPAYNRSSPVHFGKPEDYFALPGIAAFRANNYRTDSAYGTATVSEKALTRVWSGSTGTLTNADGTTWTGSGWTGQPLIVEWPSATRRIMNLYDHKKAKDGLTEVIYATLDGCIYFLDLSDGSFTRDPLRINMPFKGSGSLDPRGYPLMYVGSGDENNAGDHPRMYIISLIDGQILYEGGFNDPLALRTDHDNWSAFDSSPLVCAANDTLIWPGENGLLYTMRLNTFYDAIGGTIEIQPSAPVAARYNTSRSNNDTYWYGYEASPVVVDHYLYVSENGGMFYCIDLNTMQLVWAQDTKDDSNATPVYEAISDTEGYLYTAPSLHWTADGNGQGPVSLYKLNAANGEIVWEVPYKVHTVSGVSGGVQASPLLGRKGTSLENTVVYSISRTPDVDSGLLVALDTANGAERWRLSLRHYAWSSPVAVYDANGQAYILLGDSAGNLVLVDGATGEVADRLSVGTMIEATPAVYNNRLVIGTKCQTIQGIDIQ